MALDSCDCFVALPSVTKNGCIIFAKNADRPKDEVMEVVYQAAADHGAGSKVQCTYIEIDQVDHTHAVILSKPAWMWGAEMGANEHGVVIGNEAVWTKDTEEALDEKLLGMDFLRLALERASSASKAVDVITSLLEAHGQGGPGFEKANDNITYDNSYMIADRSEVWILETAAQHWAAQKVTDGTRNISNLLSIGTQIDSMSAGLKDHAQSKGYWDGSGDFDFAKSFQSDKLPINLEGQDDPKNRVAGGKDLLEEKAADKSFSMRSMMEILRNDEKGICRVGKSSSATTGSMISVLPPPGSSSPPCHWFTATPNTQCSVFKPFVFSADVNIGKLTLAPTFDDDPAKTKPRFQSTVDRGTPLHKAHATMNPIPGDAVKTEILSVLKKMENQCIDDAEAFLADFDESKMFELKDLFKDIVESEIKFYHGK